MGCHSLSGKNAMVMANDQEHGTGQALGMQGSYTFLDYKFKDFSRTLKDIFSIFQGLHAL